MHNSSDHKFTSHVAILFRLLSCLFNAAESIFRIIIHEADYEAGSWTTHTNNTFLNSPIKLMFVWYDRYYLEVGMAQI